MSDLNSRGLLTEAASLRARMDEFTRRISREIPAAEADEMRETQARADAALSVFGERASSPAVGETGLEYRRRILETVAKHSPKMRNENFYGLGAAGLAEMERHVFMDVQTAAQRAAESRPGVLVAQQSRDESGRLITRFVGDPLAWMQHYMSGAQVGRINRDPPPG